MPKLIIIRGNSGSGKTTIAKQLQHKMGQRTMLIPQDTVRREIVRTKDMPGNPSIQLINEITTYGHRIGYDVIIEGILVRKRYGKMLRDLVRLFDETYTYYFDASFEETLRRHQTKPNSHEFGEKEMREWYIENDLLGLPGEKVIPEHLSEKETLLLILSDVQ